MARNSTRLREEHASSSCTKHVARRSNSKTVASRNRGGSKCNSAGHTPIAETSCSLARSTCSAAALSWAVQPLRAVLSQRMRKLRCPIEL